jgi:endonuclease/exonuclease/phosphatase (EEP) superfamily protein YafD
VRRTGAARYWLIWAAVIPILLWAVVRLFGLDSERGFPLVPLIAYTPYAAAGALLVAGVAVALRNWAAATVAAAATACLLAVVVPRAAGHGEALSAGAEELRVLSGNLHRGTAQAGALVALVERLRPDVLSVQELTPGFAKRLEAAGISRLLPHVLLSAQQGAGGGGLYSRLPIWRRGPSPLATFHMRWGALRLADGRVVRVVEVHPYAPTRGNIALWRESLATLPSADPSGPPRILAGDFNSTLDFADLRDLLDTGYRDAGEVTGRGLEATWPQGRILPPPVTIDHVFADERIAILGYSVEGLPGSDHRAVFARLAIPAASR